MRPQPVKSGSALSALFLRGIVEACRIRLPDFDERVLQRRAAAVDDASLQDDTLAFRVRPDQRMAEIVLIHAGDVDPVGIGADMHIRACRLRRRFLETSEFLDHQFPSGRFSNIVERRPRSTMSNL